MLLGFYVSLSVVRLKVTKPCEQTCWSCDNSQINRPDETSEA